MDSVVVSTSVRPAVGPGSIAGMVYLPLKSCSQCVGLCIPCESENHINVGPILIWDVKEPWRMTSTLAVTTLSARIERSVRHKCSENG